MMLSSVAAIAAGNVPITTCLDAAAAVKPGEFAKVEYLDPSAEGVPAFVIEVRNEASDSWELSCDARSGAIYEIESEVAGPDDPRFAGTAKLTTADAEARALALVPGRILEVEYEVDANGDPVFELDIRDGDGVERKIEVHAVTGEILETSVEHWEIGIEASERR
ncbi:PepSY domain-containing protein [Salinisphaera sp. P385]|uniref:PepSY domain-containing protein n=1 Tax=Spectribacter acetivorans TaxID=3075603 RepID=A0ABU3B504_9GAMM|nr:PepSY domain-containing protein [Salinisphaera sp. P385]MDT0617530.1 PepSY domain-containing protein [Salinisphaera sp. P385]